MASEGEGQRYWATALDEGVVAAMAEKYRTTLWLLADPPRVSASPQALRNIAGRWPGALREAQLVSPWAYRMRHRAVLDIGPVRDRAIWRGAGAAWLPLWADLHALLGDQLRWRRGPRDRAASRDAAVFLRDIAADSYSRWPSDPDELAPAGRLSSRLAYRWLAKRAGLSEQALDRILFDREGSGRP